MDQKTKGALLTWGVAMLLFFTIAIVCVGFIFAQVKEGRADLTVTYSATSLPGMKLLAESWKRYPDYIIGLGAAGGLSFGGAVFSVYNLYKARRTE